MAEKQNIKPGATPERKKARREGKRQLAQRLSIDTWANLVDLIEGKGLQRCIHELNKLKGSQYVYAYLALTEYVKPKMQRKVIVNETPQKDTFAEALKLIPLEDKMKLFKAMKQAREAQIIEIEASTPQPNVNLTPDPQPQEAKPKETQAEEVPNLKPRRNSKEVLKSKYSNK